MKIINKVTKVTEEGYIQWIENFVGKVIKKAKLQCQEVVIEDIEWSKRVFLKVDGEDYDIRTWSFHPIKQDSAGKTCAESVRYTLFKTIWDGNGGGHGEEVACGHGEEVACGELIIEWNN